MLDASSIKNSSNLDSNFHLCIQLVIWKQTLYSTKNSWLQPRYYWLWLKRQNGLVHLKIAHGGERTFFCHQGLSLKIVTRVWAWKYVSLGSRRECHQGLMWNEGCHQGLRMHVTRVCGAAWKLSPGFEPENMCHQGSFSVLVTRVQFRKK